MLDIFCSENVSSFFCCCHFNEVGVTLYPALAKRSSVLVDVGIVLCITCCAGWSWESLRGWFHFLKLGVPGAAMLGIDWISYEIAAFVLGSIDEVQLALNVIIFNLLELFYVVSLTRHSLLMSHNLIKSSEAECFEVQYYSEKY